MCLHRINNAALVRHASPNTSPTSSARDKLIHFSCSSPVCVFAGIGDKSYVGCASSTPAGSGSPIHHMIALPVTGIGQVVRHNPEHTADYRVYTVHTLNCLILSFCFNSLTVWGRGPHNKLKTSSCTVGASLAMA